MSEEAKQLSVSNQAIHNRLIWTVVICTLIAEALRVIKWLPFPIGLSLVYFVVLSVGYWIGIRPALTFGRFLLRLTTFLAVVIIGLWLIPDLLAKWIWIPLAYALPVFGVSVWSYWMPPLYPRQRERGRFSIWLLCSIAVAFFYGWAMKSGK